MNGRLYDPALHRFLQLGNYVQDPFNTQNFNRYGYCLNNPLVYVDENGEFIITALIVGAIIGAYIGGSQANGTYNSFKWDFNNVETWGGIVGGGIIGCLSGGVAAYAGGVVAAGLATYGITGGVIGGAVIGATSGLVGGFMSGGFMSQLPGGNGKFWESAGWGALSGFIGGAVLGGATGALTTSKGHNIWTGREIQQPVQTLEGAPIKINLEANDLDGLSLQDAKLQIKQAIPDNGGPIRYKSDYFKVDGLDATHNWNRETIEIVADYGKIFNSVGKDGSKQILIQMLGQNMV